MQIKLEQANSQLAEVYAKVQAPEGEACNLDRPACRGNEHEGDGRGDRCQGNEQA